MVIDRFGPLIETLPSYKFHFLLLLSFMLQDRYFKILLEDCYLILDLLLQLLVFIHVLLPCAESIVIVTVHSDVI